MGRDLRAAHAEPLLQAWGTSAGEASMPGTGAGGGMAWNTREQRVGGHLATLRDYILQASKGFQKEMKYCPMHFRKNIGQRIRGGEIRSRRSS